MSSVVEGPLAGINVLEVSQYIAGPFAGQQLAEAGADVIKVERPGWGDPMRNFASDKVPLYGPNFLAFNRNKRSIELDLQTSEGVETFRALAARADVVLENFRPDVMGRLGIGFDELRKDNPRLIYCSIAGFAADGPNARRPAFDTIGQALSGMLHLFADPEKPRMRGPTVSDQVTGLYAANAILSALVERGRTGVGRRIDVAMMDASIAFIADAFSCHTEAGIEWDSGYRAAMSHAFVLRCADDQLMAVHLGGPGPLWMRFLKAVEQQDLANDARFAALEDRVRNWSALLDELALVFARRSREEWMRRLVAADIPAAEVLRLSEVIEDEAVRHSRLFEVVDHPVAGPVTLVRRVARFDGSRGAAQRTPPLLGEHEAEILAEINLTPAR